MGGVRLWVLAFAAAALAGPASAQRSGWTVATVSGCNAILSDPDSLNWTGSAGAMSWSGGCDARGLITGQGTLKSEFSSNGIRYRVERTGAAADGMFTGNASEATYSDDYKDPAKPGQLTRHDFGDVRNPMPGFYKDGCLYYVSGGKADMSRAAGDCQASGGASLRAQLLGGGQTKQAAAPPPVQSLKRQTWTQADAEACRPQLTGYHNGFIDHELKHSAMNYAPDGKFPSPENVQYTQKFVAKLRTLDPVSYFWSSMPKCEADDGSQECTEWAIFGMFSPGAFEMIVNGASQDEYIQLLRSVANGKNIDGGALPPPEPTNAAEGHVQYADYRPVTICLAGVWMKKYDAARGIGQPSAPAPAPRVSTPPSSSGTSSGTLSATTQNPTAGTPGGSGGYVSLGLPDNKGATPPGPPIRNNTTTQSGTASRAAGILGGSKPPPLAQSKPSTQHNPAGEASNCVILVGREDFDKYGIKSAVSDRSLLNTCKRKVSIAWCTEGSDCKPAYSNLWTLQARGEQGDSYPVLMGGRGTRVNWAACYNGFIDNLPNPRNERIYACK